MHSKRLGNDSQYQQDKGKLIGRHATKSDVAPIQTMSGSIEMVDYFPYLGSIVASDESELSARIAKADRAFGCMRKLIFRDSNLSLSTK